MSSRINDMVTDRLEMSGRVERYSCWPTLNRQDIGQHCWQIYMIYYRIFGVPAALTALYINLHDSEELITGDAPFPTKAENPDFKAASEKVEIKARARLGYDLPDIGEEERARVKVCDLLEMMTFGMHEREMGNMLAVPIVIRTAAFAEGNILERLPEADRVRVHQFVRKEWERHCRVLRTGDPTFEYRYETRGRVLR